MLTEATFLSRGHIIEGLGFRYRLPYSKVHILTIHFLTFSLWIIKKKSSLKKCLGLEHILKTVFKLGKQGRSSENEISYSYRGSHAYLQQNLVSRLFARLRSRFAKWNRFQTRNRLATNTYLTAFSVSKYCLKFPLFQAKYTALCLKYTRL